MQLVSCPRNTRNTRNTWPGSSKYEAQKMLAVKLCWQKSNFEHQGPQLGTESSIGGLERFKVG